MPQQGQLGRDEKIWRRWSRKTDPQNTNQIAKALDMPEPEVDRIIAAHMNAIHSLGITDGR